MTNDGSVKATQYLTFNLGEEVYAIDISKVREVLDFTSITKVPQAPDFMRGVINLRGGVVPSGPFSAPSPTRSRRSSTWRRPR
jgi:purine-binding chemotaxis protein CheW